MYKVLESTETNGTPFTTHGGQYQIIVDHGGGTVDLEMMIPESDPVAFIKTDESWNRDGVRAMWLAFDATYRMNASTAGSEAWVMPVLRGQTDVPPA